MRPKEKMKNFERDLRNGDLEKYGFVPNGSTLLPGFTKGSIEICYCGGLLSFIEIDDIYIEDIVDDIGDARGPDDELAYRITDKAISYLRDLVLSE